MRKTIRKINNGVSIVILGIFYFIFMGLGHVLYRLFVPRGKKEIKSYWDKEERVKQKSFLSPY